MLLRGWMVGGLAFMQAVSKQAIALVRLARNGGGGRSVTACIFTQLTQRGHARHGMWDCGVLEQQRPLEGLPRIALNQDKTLQ